MAPINGSSPTENGHLKQIELLRKEPPRPALTSPDAERRVEAFDPSLVPIYRNLISSVGEDPDREGLQKTPERAAKAIWFFTTGYRQSLKGAHPSFLF